LFDDVTPKVSEQWDRACDYLDEDIASGYVRILQELIAASWADPAIGRSCAPDSWAGATLFEVSRGEPSENSEVLVRFRRKTWVP
jgi:hypothetical protein